MYLTLFILSYASAQCELPNMSVGNFNVTTDRQLKEIIKKEPVFLIGLTASWCEDCCKNEPIYQKLLDKIQSYTPRVPLVRVDVGTSLFIKKYLTDHEEVPKIVGVRKGVFYKFFDLYTTEKLIRFTDRLLYPVQYLTDLEEVLDFLRPPRGGFESLKILGVFYDGDLKRDFEKAMESISNWFTTEIRAVANKNLVKELLKIRPDLRYYNGIVLLKPDETKYLDLEVPQDMLLWVVRNSAGLLEELTAFNFQMYEFNELPVLMMFIDPQDIKNPEHLSLFKKVSRNYIDKVKFVWVDGTKPDVIIKRKKLGLVSDKLPSVAFNLGSYDISPFPESKEITEERLDYFVKSFLDGKKYAPKEINVKNELVPECTHVNRDEFKDKVLVEGYDSIFLLYSSDNHKESKTVAPVFNRLCKRLRELEFPYLNAYAIDLGAGSVYRTVEISKVPAIYMVPAYNKSPPYIMYEGRNDALSLMLFVQKYAEIKFNLPDLPHLSPDEVEEYWKAKSKLREELQDTVSKENELKEYI